jgi:hypothetical protein
VVRRISSSADIVYGRVCASSDTMVIAQRPIPSEASINPPDFFVCGRHGLPAQNAFADVVFTP